MKNNKRNTSVFKRISAAITACCLLSGTLNSYQVNKSPVYAEAADSSFIIEQERRLSYAGGRNYTVTLDAASYFTSEFSPEDVDHPGNGYYEVPCDGKYLVQLWGGNGGGSGTSEGNTGTGKGGAGGYVWSIMTLDKGDVLLYSIGTNGMKSAYSGKGGGKNGDGGGHGEDGNIAVGGGGGYSAVYYYPKGSFGGSAVPTEAERRQNYVLIAGGGGGAGGYSTNSDYQRLSTPDGGDAGSIGSSLSGSIVNSEVPGTYYIGANGVSSGTSAKYVGIGGSAPPGTAVVSEEKDFRFLWWEGTYESSSTAGKYWADGGAGGAGNLNGGGGGAGYCGGSGGVMKTIVDDDSIGGGGGGSSFIASASNMTNDLSVLSEGELAVFESNAAENTSTVGGFCNIAYLSGAQTDFSLYENVNFNIPVSDYFDITAVDTHGNGTWNAENNTITGVDISPDEQGRIDKRADITLTFTAKDSFAGGNNVPLLDGTISVTPSEINFPDFKVDNELDRVNVPTNFTLDTYSFWHDAYTEADAPITESELYKTNISELTTKTDFISSVSNVSITPSLAGNNKPQATQAFDISYTVTPSSNAASVGPVQNEKTYSGTAVVNIREEGTVYVPNDANINSPTASLNDDNSDIKLKTSRTLEYADDEYKTAISVNASSKAVPYGVHATNYSLDTPTNYDTSQDINLTKGWYLVEAWGSNGGKGGNATAGSSTGNGGAGGKGGYVSGYLNVSDNGMSLSIEVYSVPKQATSNSVNASWGAQSTKGDNGSGGKATHISSSGQDLIYAGGGGGGAGGYAKVGAIAGILGGNETKDGASGGDATGNGSGYDGTGATAAASSTTNGGTAGTGGKNYKADGVFSEAPASGLTPGSTTNPSSDGSGYVRITKIKETTTFDDSDKAAKQNAVKAILQNLAFDLSGEWADYFGGGAISQSNIHFSNDNITISDDTTNHTLTATASCEITVGAQPVDGFLGGNDVPLFSDDGDLELQYTYNNRPDSGNIPLADNDALKYVNVAVPEPEFAVQDIERFYGEAVDIPDDLITKSFEVDPDGILDDFVTVEKTVTPSGSDDPNNGTAVASQKYSFNITLTPNEAEKATVIGKFSATECSHEAELTVNYRLLTELTNITCSAAEKIPMNEDRSTVLTAANGYKLPSSITVMCGDNVLSAIDGYRYSKDSGELYIPKEKISDNITIIAEADIIVYDLVFRYYLDSENTMLTEQTFSYPAGTVFDENSSWRSEFYDPFEPEEIEGMTFRWDWGETGEEPLAEMPAQNWSVIGKYSRNRYDLIIHYQDMEGNKLAEDCERELYYGDTYSVASPAVNNYIPQTAVVSGDITDNTEITVKYEKIVGKLVVVYVDEDGNTVSTNYEANVDAGSAYSAVSPSITGYTPDIQKVSGTMPSEGGVYQVVAYSPNMYTLTLNTNGGSLSSEDGQPRNVFYGKELGYCVKNEGKYSFKALPVPAKEGSTFKGWQMTVGGEAVTVGEDAVYTLTDNAVLTAVWEVNTVTLKVYYYFENGTEAAETVTYTENPNGETLTNGVVFPLHDIAEETRVNEVINGEHYDTQCDTEITMGFVDRTVTVTFVGKTYTLNVKYKDENGSEISGVTDSYEVKYGTGYQYNARTPESVNASYNNHYASPSTIEGTMTGDATVYVSFIRQDTVIHVTVDWSSLNFKAQNVRWDTERHLYYADSYLTDDTGKEYGVITVTNSSTNSTAIRAALSYEAKFGYESVQAAYTDSSDAVISSVVVPANESKEIRVTPQNGFYFTGAGAYNVGTCTVELSAGG